ncbi:MAG: hypothetical protein PHV05_03250 [Candidatus Riflebacteria bacterium]|nr:hypothetical protein [Candidatus Riflebacteria bacterium]
MTKSQVNFLIKTGLFLATVGFLIIIAFHVDPHASMDAAYYHVMVDQLEQEKGFAEPVIWHNLNKYDDLEHPIDYWMPLGIVLYYLARLTMGIAGEVWLNIFIWAFLAVIIYSKVLTLTKSRFCALVAFLAHIFCGRNIFYVLTTDNMAFSAILGYFYFNSLGNKDSKWYLTAIIGGLIALLRIGGVIFAAMGGIFEFYKTRRLRVLFLYSCLVLVILSPWIIRNIQVLNTPWPSNTKAIFLRNYGDFFNEEFKGTLEDYLVLGYKEIISQKLKGLRISLLNLVLLPAHFLFFPVWFPGLIAFWRRGNKGFTLFFVIFFWLLCGLAFTHQSEKGTALHISAFFYPAYAILTGMGLSALLESSSARRKKLYYFIGVSMVLWGMCVSYLSTRGIALQYSEDNAPYIQLFKEFPPASTDLIVSPYPLYVYYLTGCKGVVASKHTSKGPGAMADKYACNLIVTSTKNMHVEKPDPQSWQTIASHSLLVLYQRR